MNKMATAMTEPAMAPGGIPLDLAPLLSPYAHYRRLSVRIEQLPPQARFSKGSNNGDRTWSLKPNDLDDLEFLPPEGASLPISLAIRIIGIDDDDEATILAQFDLPVSLGDTVTAPAKAKPSARPTASDANAQWQRRIERRVAAALRLGERNAEKQLAAAESNWHDQYEVRLADIANQLTLEWEQKNAAEQTARESADAKSAASAKKLSELTKQLEAATAMAAKAEAAQDRNLSELQVRHDKALQQQAKKAETHLAKELDRTLARAEAKWEKERDKQIAGAVKQAVQESEAQAKSELEQSHAQWLEESNRAITAAGDKTAQAEAALAKHDSDLANAQKDFDRAQAKSEKEHGKLAAVAVKQAVQSSAEEADARLEQARAQWLEQSTRKIDAANDKAAQAEAVLQKASNDSEVLLQSLRDDVAKAAATLASRETDLADARQEWERTQAKAERETEQRVATAVTQAVRASEAESEVRLEQARALWLEQSGREIAAANEQAAQAATALEDRGQADETLLQGLRDEIAETRTTLAERENALADARKETERATAQSEKETEQRIASAVKQAVRVSEAEAEAHLEQALELWQSESNREIEAANDKCARAEAALDRLSNTGDSLQQGLRVELTEALAALAQRDTDLAERETAHEGRVIEAVTSAVQNAESEAEVRLEQARVQWQEEFDHAIEAAKGDATATLAKRDAELADSRHERDRADAKRQAELESRVAEAVSEATRTAEMEAKARLEQAHVQWLEQSQREIAEANEKTEKAVADLKTVGQKDETLQDDLRRELTAREAEVVDAHRERDQAQAAVDEQGVKNEELLQGLRQELAETKSALATRETELADASKNVSHAPTEAPASTIEAELAAARRAWQSELDERLAEVEERTTARLEESRAATQTEQADHTADHDGAAVESVEQARRRWNDEAQTALATAQQEWQAAETKRLAAAHAEWRKNAKSDLARGAVTDVAKQQRKSRIGRRLIRVVVIAGCLAAAVFGYVTFKPMIVERFGPTLAELTNGVAPLLRTIEDATQSELQLLTDATKPHMAVSVKIANVRAGPSTATAVITKLPQNTRVTVLEEKGDWIQIRLVENGAEQGWLHRSLLKDSADR